MKRIFILLFCFSFTTILFAQPPYVWDDAGAGNWSSPATWVKPAGVANDYPQTTDDIVIINNSFSVTLDVDPTVQSLLLDNAGLSFGSLVIPSGRALTTSGDVTLNEGSISDRTILTFNGGGTLNVGGNFIMEGGRLTTTGTCLINIGGYYKHTGGDVIFSGDIELDITTGGALAADINEHNFYIGSAAEYTFGTGNVFLLIDLFNGHLGTKEELYIENFTVTNNSTGGDSNLEIMNTDGTDSEYYMKADQGLGNLNIEIGSGNILNFSHITTPPAQPVYYRNITVTSGKLFLSNGSNIEISANPPGESF